MNPRAFHERFLENLTNDCGVRAKQAGIVAVSGGSDSVALLVSMSRARNALDLDLRVVSVDHGLRPEAGDEVEGVRRLCERIGLQHIVVPVDTRRRAQEEKLCIEEAARVERLNALETQRSASGAEWIALAHSRSDQAETVILRIRRGVGLDGLGCMRPRQGHLIRPLLWANRKILRDILVSDGVDWIEDPMNQDHAFERVRVRENLMPHLDESRLAEIAAEAQKIHVRLERGERALLARDAHASGDVALLDLPGLSDLGDAVATRLLRHAASFVHMGRPTLWRDATAELLALSRGDRGFDLTAHRLRARRLAGSPARLVLERRPRASRYETLKISGPGSYRLDGLMTWVVVGGDRPRSPLWGTVPGDHEFEVRPRLPGDIMRGTERGLKKLWERTGLWRHLRDWVPLVVAEDGIRWSAIAPDRGQGDTLVSFVLDVDNPLRQWSRASKYG